jgi:hypothetical protein
MIDTIETLENGLKSQLTSLTNDIRAAESSLISTKEGYLKVQGALEILAILKQKAESEDNSDALDVALG